MLIMNHEASVVACQSLLMFFSRFLRDDKQKLKLEDFVVSNCLPAEGSTGSASCLGDCYVILGTHKLVEQIISCCFFVDSSHDHP